MSLSYHVIYIALGLILCAMTRHVHVVCGVFFVLYLVWLGRRFSLSIVLVICGFSLALLRPVRTQTLPSVIQGRVVSVSDNHVLLRTSQGKVKACTDESFRYNDVIRVKVTPMDINENKDGYGFDEVKYMKGANIRYKVRITSVLSVKHHWSLANLITKLLSSNEDLRSYQSLFVLGAKDENITDDYAEMVDLSIVHLFALSGMHVSVLHSVLTAILANIMTKEKADRTAKLLMGFYIISIPYNISLQRAFLMMVGKDVVKGRFNSLDLLGFLIIGHVVWNPAVVLSASFVFSYAIYAAVILTQRVPLASLWIYLSGVPIVLSINYSVNLISFVLAWLLEPLMSVFYVGVLASLVLPVASLPATLMIRVFQMIMAMTSAISKTISFQKPTLSFIVLYYVCLGRLVSRLSVKQSVRTDVRFLIGLFLAFHIYSVYKPWCDVTMINVGQGDCTLISLPFNQGHYLIDTGGNVDYDLATHNVIPCLKSKGVQKLDAVYISHYDYDHYGALESLKAHFRVDKVIDTPQEDFTNGPMTISCLSTGHVYEDINDNSNVLFVTIDDWHYVFTGDIGVSAEEALYQNYGTLPCEVLKVGHHGSSGSTSVTFLELVHPKIAMIGVGKHNRYGHPSDLVINRLEERGVMILRTDEDGTFTIRSVKGRHWIYR